MKYSWDLLLIVGLIFKRLEHNIFLGAPRDIFADISPWGVRVPH
jgi:hypothetical protein